MAENSVPVEEAMIIIVGGGFAGLAAAYRLELERRNGAPLTYLLLEASALGGRTQTVGPDYELGAGYVGLAQNCIQFMIRALQVPTFSTHLPKDQEWIYHGADGSFEKFPGDDPLDFPGVPNGLFRLGELDLLALDLRRYLRDPWRHPLAKQLDSITVADWIVGELGKYRKGDEEHGMSPLTAEVFTASVRAAFSLEPSDVSFFYLLYYAACAGSYSALVDIAGGEASAEGTRFLFGTADFVNAVQDQIKASIRPGVQVTRIEDTAAGVLITAQANGQAKSFKAAKVIVAMSPPVSSKIIYSVQQRDVPQLAAREALCNRMAGHIGKTIKGFVRFKSPVWREKRTAGPGHPQSTNGWMGYMLSMAPTDQYPVGWTLDNVWIKPEPPIDARGHETRYSLMTFIGGQPAVTWGAKTKLERAAAVIAQLKEVFELQNSDFFDANPLDSYTEFDWPNERLGIPAPAANMPPNTLSDETLAPTLRKPLGNIHWAGSELATEWCGYMNGAVESGFTAVSEALLPLTGRLARPLSDLV